MMNEMYENFQLVTPKHNDCTAIFAQRERDSCARQVLEALAKLSHSCYVIELTLKGPYVRRWSTRELHEKEDTQLQQWGKYIA